MARHGMAGTHVPLLLLTLRSTKTRCGQSRSSWSPPHVQHSFLAASAPPAPGVGDTTAAAVWLGLGSPLAVVVDEEEEAEDEAEPSAVAAAAPEATDDDMPMSIVCCVE
jgi:hypothetical protein